MSELRHWIEAHQAELVAELQTLLRQPSISAQGIGLRECAELLGWQMIADGLADAN